MCSWVELCLTFLGAGDKRIPRDEGETKTASESMLTSKASRQRKRAGLDARCIPNTATLTLSFSLSDTDLTEPEVFLVCSEDGRGAPARCGRGGRAFVL
eukprot:m.327533 g.327533  ORF g.327533 m.327533 type:complete len:99 (-) comp16492_c0_seq8:2328-2624(-)